MVSGWGQFDEIPVRNFHQKVTSCRNKISSWKKQNPTNSDILIKELKQKIDQAQDDENSTTEEVEDLRKQLILAFREENMFWEKKQGPVAQTRRQEHKIPSCHYKTKESQEQDNQYKRQTWAAGRE